MHQPPSVDIGSLREAIYLGRGYAVLRGFIAPAEAAHLLAFWRAHPTEPAVTTYDKRARLVAGCPDASELRPERQRHYNYFWNRPRDAFTYHTAWRLQTLRNAIEGRPEGSDFIPFQPRYRVDPRFWSCASYRVVDTRRGGAVAEHVDSPLDHSRVQLSLSLTSWGEDYVAGGLVVRDGLFDGKPVQVCRDEAVMAGDLVIFRYFHRHGVSDVDPGASGRGYARLMVPLEKVPVDAPTAAPLGSDGAGEQQPRGLRSRARAGARELRRLVRDLRDPARGETQPTATPPEPPPPYDDGSLRDGLDSTYYDRELVPLMQLGVRCGVDPAEVYYHRGLWGRFGMFDRWQYEALLRAGLEPHHDVLDIGCGILRLGMHLVPWLDDARYCGIDPVAAYLRVGEAALRELVGTDKEVQLRCDADFDFAGFGRAFDFAIAHSVFTHLSWAQITRCFEALVGVMKPGGRLLFTVTFGRPEEWGIVYVGGHPMTKSRTRDLAPYEELAARLGFRVERVAGEGQDHPTQHVCLATF